VLRAQNRGQYLPQPFHGQFARLGPGWPRDEDKLFDALGTHLVAFGEWCAARHSLDYATLPDWWMLFDVYDRQEQRFWSTTRAQRLAAEMGFNTVPRLYRRRSHAGPTARLVHAHDSQFRQGHLEGIVVRRENADWLENRAKLVRGLHANDRSALEEPGAGVESGLTSHCVRAGAPAAPHPTGAAFAAGSGVVARVSLSRRCRARAESGCGHLPRRYIAVSARRSAFWLSSRPWKMATPMLAVQWWPMAGAEGAVFST
jgi:hypothetical protein